MVHLVAWTVHECSSFRRMVMNVYKCQDTFSLFFCFTVPDQLFHSRDFWLQNVFHSTVTRFCCIITLQVEPVEIFTDKACSIIACHNSIRVGHGHYLEYKAISQMTCIFRYQVVDHSMQNPRRVCLSWVDSTTDYDSTLLGGVYDIVCYCEQWDLKTAEWTSQCCHWLVELGACFYSLLKECVRVRNRLSDVNEFVSTREVKIKGKAKVLLFALAHIKSCRNQCLFFNCLYLALVIATLCWISHLACVWVDLAIANVRKIAGLPCNILQLLHDEPFVINLLETC